MIMPLKPKNITLDRPQQRLVIDWNDGTQCAYALNVLREGCPCADCRGGHANMGKPPDIDSLLVIPLVRTKSYEVARVEPVGHYALKVTWTDGHDAGIYTWPYLRELCAGLAAKSGQDDRYRPIGQ